MRILFFILGIAGIADTAFVRTFSNWNLGVILPAVLGIPLLLYGIFYVKINNLCEVYTSVKIAKLCIRALYFIFLAMLAVAVIYMATPKTARPAEECDVVIVLGAAVHGDEPSLTLTKRLDKAIDCLNANENAVCIVSGGMGNEENISEAQAMENYLISGGIDKSRILKEDKATTTRENFKYSKEIADEHFKYYDKDYKAVFVTSEFHIARAQELAKKEGVEAQGVAAYSKWYILPNFCLRETFAIWHMWIFG